MPDYKHHKTFLKGALVLTAAALFVKILSALYRVPFQNIVGDTGFYIYQQVYPFYGIAAALSLAGFPVVISRLIVEEEYCDRYTTKQIILSAFIALSLFGILLFLLLYFGASSIARLMGDDGLIPLLEVVSFMFLLLPFLSVLRGLFQAEGNMLPTASSQTTEQIVRVVCILLFSFYLIETGHTLYDAGKGAIFGSLLGGVAGVAILAFSLRNRPRSHWQKERGLPLKTGFAIGKKVLVHGAMVSVGSMLLVLFQFIDSLSVYPLLLSSGVDVEEAKVIKGIFDRGQPLLQLGTATAAAMSLSTVPMIASYYRRRDQANLQKGIGLALKLSTIVGVGAAFGLANLMRPVNVMLFESPSGSGMLSLLSLSILFTSYILAVSGILQGMGHIFAPTTYIAAGLMVKWVGNMILVPHLDALGAAVSTLCGLSVIASLMTWKAVRDHRLFTLKTLPIAPLIVSVLLMTAVLQGWRFLFELSGMTGRSGSVVQSLIGVAIGGSMYLYVIFKTGSLTEEEADGLPFGSRIYRLFTNRKKKEGLR